MQSKVEPKKIQSRGPEDVINRLNTKDDANKKARGCN